MERTNKGKIYADYKIHFSVSINLIIIPFLTRRSLIVKFLSLNFDILLSSGVELIVGSVRVRGLHLEEHGAEY